MELRYCMLELLNQDPRNVMTLDIETTGFCPPQDEILSLAIIDGAGKTLFYEKFKPEHNIDWPKAQAVNGISPKDVSKCCSLAEYVDEINTLLSEVSVIVGYNQVGFDVPFLECFGIKVPEKTLMIDVMLDYAELNGEWDTKHQDWKWQKLTACAEHYGYQYHAHDALEDVKATLFCARKCAEDQHREKAIYQLEDGRIMLLQRRDTGFEFMLYDLDDRATGGGRIDDPGLSLLQARTAILMKVAGPGSVYTYPYTGMEWAQPFPNQLTTNFWRPLLEP